MACGALTGLHVPNVLTCSPKFGKPIGKFLLRSHLKDCVRANTVREKNERAKEIARKMKPSASQLHTIRVHCATRSSHLNSNFWFSILPIYITVFTFFTLRFPGQILAKFWLKHCWTNQSSLSEIGVWRHSKRADLDPGTQRSMCH